MLGLVFAPFLLDSTKNLCQQLSACIQQELFNQDDVTNFAAPLYVGVKANGLFD